jgi:hypothetical protein
MLNPLEQEISQQDKQRIIDKISKEATFKLLYILPGKSKGHKVSLLGWQISILDDNRTVQKMLFHSVFTSSSQEEKNSQSLKTGVETSK